jgi:cytosine/adenosine deaminase-related metal-dependent hydrolase
VVAAGAPGAVIEAAGPDALQLARPNALLLPGLVNAHCHLELARIGPQRYTGDFVEWIMMLRRHWPDPTDPLAPANAEFFADAARQGARRSLEAGVMTVGDITRHDRAIEVVGQTGLRGVSFVELFGMGPPWDEPALARIDRMIDQAEGTAEKTTPGGHQRRVHIGVQPHAPYSAGPRLFTAAARSGLPVSTHLAEMPDEAQFVAGQGGPFVDLLEQLGKWDERFAGAYHHASPVQWAGEHLKQSAWLCAHCNYVDEADLETLARTGTTIAYCPRASRYFGHEGHRYRDMLAAGVNVCLGTDSSVCHGSFSVLDEMRYLHQRDQVAPALLLEMASVRGMRGLGFDAAEASFAPGRWPGVIAVSYDELPMNEIIDARDGLAALLKVPTDRALHIEPLALAGPAAPDVTQST